MLLNLFIIWKNPKAIKFIKHNLYILIMNNFLLILLIIGSIGAIYWVLKGEKFNKELMK